MQVYTKKAHFDVDVNAILPRVLAAFPFMKRDISSLSMKGIRQTSQGYFCYSDTILLIDHPCPESLALKIWSERQSA
ncbi:Uncharacterized protein APZ42_023334 [Daphnia magna]|nr:Uncharacterized protein APZ42_023334 [Daphnia magna]